MKSGKSWWMPVLLGVLLVAVLVGVAGARPNERAQGASGTRQLIIQAADFYPATNTFAFVNNGYYLYSDLDGSVVRFIAPVQFPAPYYVTVEKVQLFAYDNNTTGQIRMGLVRTKPSVGTQTSMAFIHTGYASADPVIPRTWTDTSISPNVKNPAHGTYLWVQISDDTALDLYGVRIFYHTGKQRSSML